MNSPCLTLDSFAPSSALKHSGAPGFSFDSTNGSTPLLVKASAVDSGAALSSPGIKRTRRKPRRIIAPSRVDVVESVRGFFRECFFFKTAPSLSGEKAKICKIGPEATPENAKRVTNCFNTVMQLSHLFSGPKTAAKIGVLLDINFAAYLDVTGLPASFPQPVKLTIDDFPGCYAFTKFPPLRQQTWSSASLKATYRRIARKELLPRMVRSIASELSRVPRDDKRRAYQVFSPQMKEMAKDLRRRVIQDLRKTVAKNQAQLRANRSFVYYVAISKPDKPSDSHIGHSFALEQYLNNHGKPSYRLYQSFQGKFSLSEWLGDASNYALSQDAACRLLSDLEIMFDKEQWDENSDATWRGWFRGPSYQVSSDMTFIDHTPDGRAVTLKGTTFRYLVDGFNPTKLKRQMPRRLSYLQAQAAANTP